MFARSFALVMIKQNGFPAAFTSSMVSATAHNSTGEGCTGIKTKSASPMIAALWSEIAGAVSIKQKSRTMLSGNSRQSPGQLLEGNLGAHGGFAFPTLMPAGKAALLVGVYYPCGAVTCQLSLYRQKGGQRCFRATPLLRRDNYRFHRLLLSPFAIFSKTANQPIRQALSYIPYRLGLCYRFYQCLPFYA
jgi:hypothetical protein